jgi:hypothetical protein
MGGKATPPPPPDYLGAAEASAEASQEAANQQMYFNRPTINTPFGGESWTYQPVSDPVTGKEYTTATMESRLTPEAQEALSGQLRVQAARSGFAEDLLGRVEEGFRDPMDFSQFGGYQGLQIDPTQARGEAFSRLQELNAPQRQQDRARLETQLANQGITQGSEAYDNAMRQLGDQEMRQSMQMMQASGAEAQQMQGMDIQAQNYANNLRQMQLAEALQERGLGLNELNALLTGQQVSAPQMPGFKGAALAESADILGATQMQAQHEMDIFNTQQASKDALTSGLMSMGSSAMMMCDIRVKRNLEHIGYYEDDIPCYIFQYVWGEEWFVGPVAQEVEQVHPELVVEIDGIKHVKIGGLGYAH